MKSEFFTRLYIAYSSLLLHSSSDAMCEVKVQLGASFWRCSSLMAHPKTALQGLQIHAQGQA